MSIKFSMNIMQGSGGYDQVDAEEDVVSNAQKCSDTLFISPFLKYDCKVAYFILSQL